MLMAKLIHTLANLGSHTRINLDSNSLFTSFQKRCSQVTSTGTDFKNYVGWFDSRFLNNLLDDEGILQDMLTECLIESEIITSSRSLRDSLRVLFVHYLI